MPSDVQDINKRFQQLQDISSRYELLVNNLLDVVWVRDLQENLLFVTPSVQKLTGYTVEEYQELPIEQHFDASSLQQIRKQMKDLVLYVNQGLCQPEEDITLRLVAVHKNGQTIHVEDKIRCLCDEQGKATSLLGVRRDITAETEAQKALQRSQERFHLAVDSTNDGIWDWDVLTNTVYFSPSLKSMLGYRDAELPNVWKTWHTIAFADDLAMLMEKLSHHMADPSQQFDLEFRAQHKDGSIRWIQSIAKTIVNANGQTERMVGVHRDTTEQKMQNPMTGLPNEVYFFEKLKASYARLQQEATAAFAIVEIGLDACTTIDATYGENIRNLYYFAIAKKLKGICYDWHRKQGLQVTVATTLDYRFSILFENMNDLQKIKKLIEQMNSIVQRPVTIDSLPLVSSTSIGLAIVDSTQNSLQEIASYASTALNRARESTTESFEVFTPAMRTHIQQSLQISSSFRQALASNDIEPYFQPIYYTQNEKLAGFEALARWHHAELGSLSPRTFIPIAEASGMVSDLDAHILTQACQAFNQWQKDGLVTNGQFISVNISAPDVLDKNFVQRVLETLQSNNLKGQQLKIEITESTLMHDVEKVKKILRNLSESGIQLSMDDFGTGYSSLSYLQQFAMDYMKIDRIFVSRVPLDAPLHHESLIMLRTLIQLAQNLGLQTIAEGVESQAHHDALVALGCDLIQGYFYAKPMNKSDATTLLGKQLQNS